MNKWKAFVAGRVVDRPAADPGPEFYDPPRSRRGAGTKNRRYYQKRVQARRAKKGYK